MVETGPEASADRSSWRRTPATTSSWAIPHDDDGVPVHLLVAFYSPSGPEGASTRD